MDSVAIATTASLALITAFYAWRTHNMASEMRRAREVQMEPYVEVFVENDVHSVNVVYLVVQNCGGGPAVNVRFKFNPEIPYRFGEERHLSDLRMFQGIGHLSAGRRIGILFGVFAEYWNDPAVPKMFSCEISYSDIWGKRHQRDEVVDLAWMKDTAPQRVDPYLISSRQLRASLASCGLNGSGSSLRSGHGGFAGDGDLNVRGHELHQ